MRVFVMDAPEGSSMQALAIAIVSDEVAYEGVRFEDLIALATPIIESIEFHPEG